MSGAFLNSTLFFEKGFLIEPVDHPCDNTCCWASSHGSPFSASAELGFQVCSIEHCSSVGSVDDSQVLMLLQQAIHGPSQFPMHIALVIRDSSYHLHIAMLNCFYFVINVKHFKVFVSMYCILYRLALENSLKNVFLPFLSWLCFSF